MKKKTKSIIAMGLVCTMLSGVLSGCGEQAETMNQQGGTANTVADGKAESAVTTAENSKTGAENTSAESTETTKITEDLTDGNIVLYAEMIGLQEACTVEGETTEEINVEINNAEADIPLYSAELKPVGYLKEGGSIVVTEHCSPRTAWYRFENPIEGTEYEYLYVQRFETIMSPDEKEIIEKLLIDTDGGTGRYQVVDAPEADMECYEFSIARKDYIALGNFVYSDEFNASKYRTFYVECTRNGDNFDVKVYYK